MFKIDEVPKYIITVDHEEPVLLEKEQLQYIVNQYDAVMKRELSGDTVNDFADHKGTNFYCEGFIPFSTESFPANFEFFDLQEEFLVGLEVSREDLPDFITQVRQMLTDD